jgi:ABC-2 type transport system ATP-binding protein
MTTPAIELAGLRKVFARGREQVVAVDRLDLTVARGEVFGLLGPNGAGKTTTVEICEGLQQPTDGQVQVLGLRWGAGRDQELRQRIGVTLQETRFFEKATVEEVIRLFASFRDRPRPVDDVIRLVALDEKRRTRTQQLSGGQRQRLAVACALVSEPELLFLDEPTTGLDPQSRRALWEVVEAFRAGGGTVLLTTHYMEEAERLCDRVGIVDHGRLIALGTPRELCASIGAVHVVEVTSERIGERLDRTRIGALPEVREHHVEGDVLSLSVAAAHLAVPALLDWLDAGGIALQDLRMRQVSLEDVFVHLTGRHLRDGA